MKALYRILFACLVCSTACVTFTSCQDKDIDRMDMVLSAPDASQITGALSGDDYIWH